MIREKKGDLLEITEGVIAHQVNCQGVMGAGVAKQIRSKLLTVSQYQAYRYKCKKFGADLLGTCYLDKIEGRPLYVAHLFGENIPTGTGLDTDYDALEEAVINLKITAGQHNLPIAIPGYLGCGLAGGNWDYVYDHILVPHFKGYPYGMTVVYRMDSIKKLWQDFGDIPMNPETECIEQSWHGFPAGTQREEIWHWFEETFDISVAADLMGQERRSEMNTLIEYLYRDASNYKKFSKSVVSGTLSEKEILEIWECLEYGELFLPAQVGLPDDNRYSGTVDDHPWFELERIGITDRPATLSLTAKDLLANFRKSKDTWEFEKYL